VKMMKLGSYEFVDNDAENEAQLESWHLDAPYGCGAVFTSDKIIRSGAPIFAKLIGEDIRYLPRNHKVQRLREITSVAERHKIARATNPDGRYGNVTDGGS
jgi:hypothetical protein